MSREHDIACGIRFDDQGNAVLAAFAKKVNASYVGEWADLGLYDEGVGSFAEAFYQVVTRTLAKGGRIHFNLDALDVANALAGDPNESIDRYTAWELQQIVRNSEWFAQTAFYANSQALQAEQVAALGIAPQK
jgi:hypothetical protein